MSFFRKLIFAVWLTLAKNEAAKRDFISALNIMKKIFHLYRRDGPSLSSPVLANVFFAELCEEIGNVRKVREACAIAIEQLDISNRKIYLRIEDTNYLKFRCKWLLHRIADHGMADALIEAELIDIKGGDLELDAITPSIRRLLPLSKKKALEVDDYILSLK